MIEPHKELVNGHEFWMLPVEGGTFLMGSLEDDAEGNGYERPQHDVKVSDFYLGKFPVTQALWRAVVTAASTGVIPSHSDTSLELNPSHFQGDDRPVEQVSWDDAQAFLKNLNGLTVSSRPKGHVYRLPTEAEWEYAARGGKYRAEGYKYAGSDRLKDVGWFVGKSGNETKPVGLKYPNQLGLFDLSGNIWEWCEDWYGGSDYYQECKRKGIVENPRGPVKGSRRVIRGGSWRTGARDCRLAYRDHGSPGPRYDYLGFRLALSPQ